ncbi:DUF4270 domain-containing protein [Flavobacterium sp.]|uniref:DUF4270 domain-containing protein n=1 Tax=Flavobacterium sp. TaxID=239 RepID=UPI00262CD1D7|nr:DUF4270 domain-containing protein [Flavobacterium sp.]
MTNTTFFKALTLVLVTLLFASCDKDYNSLGSDIIGNEHFDFQGLPFTVKAYNQKIDVVQTNNLPINSLGIINSSVFGKTRSNFVTQLQLAELAPEFGENIVVDSVVLNIPYFNTKKSTEASGRGIYELDSIYGSTPIDLRVFENGYYLRDFDPNSNYETAQKYYSDQDPLFDARKVNNEVLNDRVQVGNEPNENVAFVPSSKEVVKYKVKSENIPTTPNYYVTSHTKTSEVETRLAPSMRLHLKKSYFETRIINASDDKLVNNNAFTSYFRGLYFQVQDAADGNAMSLDFSKGTVTIYYKEDLIRSKTITNPDNSTTVVEVGNDRPMKTLVMNLQGNTVNLFDVTGNNATYLNAVNSPNTTNGDPFLYLKGGQGSKAFIELFTQPEIDGLKGTIINQANLTFTIEQAAMTGNYEPQRIYVFNADNNRPIFDYFFDNSTNSANHKFDKFLYDGIIKKEDVGGTKRGVRYKINLTEHVNNIVNKDSTNVRLGVVVTENINLSGNAALKTPILSPKKFDRVPVSSVMSPLGTVLYGNNNTPGNEAKKIKFEIYYTKPN